MSPTFPPLIEIGFVCLLQLLFGFAYNFLVEWAQVKWKFWHVSLSVIMGVFVTVAIKTAAWPMREMAGWQDGLLLLACFASSGLPMAGFSLRRSAVAPKNHKRQRWPNAARRAAETMLLELDALADKVVKSAERNEITAGLLLGMVNKLHEIKGILNSVL